MTLLGEQHPIEYLLSLTISMSLLFYTHHRFQKIESLLVVPPFCPSLIERCIPHIRTLGDLTLGQRDYKSLLEPYASQFTSLENISIKLNKPQLVNYVLDLFPKVIVVAIVVVVAVVVIVRRFAIVLKAISIVIFPIIIITVGDLSQLYWNEFLCSTGIFLHIIVVDILPSIEAPQTVSTTTYLSLFCLFYSFISSLYSLMLI